MDKDRRRTLAFLGGGVAAGVIGPAFLGCAPADDVADAARPNLPFPYAKLDPDRIGEAGYKNFYVGDCMYGVLATIVDALAEEVGEPFASFPTDVTRYGAGGVVGWGTLCGAANGAAMAIYMVSRDPARAINEVYGFYESEALPNFIPSDARFQLPSSVSHSTLCHVSISKWCDASGHKSYSPERADRCAQLVGSVARYTVEVLNAQFDSVFQPVHPISAAAAACRGCHDRGGVLENSLGMMDCTTCHTNQTSGHP
jgi:hypothetical protein